MKLNFRHGIWKARVVSVLPDFLEYAPVNNTITIDITDTPLVVSVAFRDKNYLIEYRTTLVNAWGPLEWNPLWGLENLTPTYYLYWSINVASGQVTRGFTPYAPIYSYTVPTNPAVDQHWFDKNQNIFQVWDGTYWRPYGRLFAGSWDGVITQLPFGSQIDLTYPGTLNAEVDAGFILYGMDQKGIRDANSTFVTTAQPLSTFHGSFTSSVRLELASSTFVANEPIPRFSVVTNNANGTISLADGVSPFKKPVGLAYQDAAIGEPVDIVSQGILYSDSWIWDPVNGKNLYCGTNGELVQGHTGDNQVASILDSRYIMVHLDMSGGAAGADDDTLQQDVPVIGTNVGAVNAGYTFLQGLTFTEFVILVSTKIINPSYTVPTMSISSSPTPGNFEVGTITNIVFNESFAQNNGGASTAFRLKRNGTTIFNAFPSTDLNVQFTLTPVSYVGEVDYAQGPILNDNFGNPYPTGRINAGTAVSNTITFVGKRLAFYGTPSATPANSADVRALPSTSFNSTNNAEVDSAGLDITPAPVPNFIISIPIGATRVVFAYPNDRRSVASVRYQELANSEVKANFVETAVTVAGANGFTSVTYRVFTYIPVQPFTIANHYKVFI